jgi:hypothetical protein
MLAPACQQSHGCRPQACATKETFQVSRLQNTAEAAVPIQARWMATGATLASVLHMQLTAAGSVAISFHLL